MLSKYCLPGFLNQGRQYADNDFKTYPMLTKKSILAWLILLVVFLTHNLISNRYQQMQYNSLFLLLVFNIILLTWASFLLLKKNVLIPGILFWVGFIWGFRLLFLFLSGSNAPLWLRGIFWADILLLLIFLLKLHGLIEEPELGSETNQA